MSGHILTMNQLVLFQQHLAEEERERSTIEKYLWDVRFFMHWAKGYSVTKKAVSSWKEQLHKSGYKQRQSIPSSQR